MKQNLEDFIRENRAAFDTEEPPVKVWKNLEEELADPEKKSGSKIIIFRRWLIAASVVTAISLGAFLLLKKNNERSLSNKGNGGRERVEQNIIMNEINPTYAKEVYHFTQLIELKQTELKQIGKDQPELYRQFMGDITMLDSAYKKLRKELPANPNREQLLEAMIQNLQLQTDLLNQQLRVIKQIKQSKKTSNESNSKII
ncbi:MAG: hypothetical protein EOO04_03890 [Chitinophagaceae bacterium]|nr:MAG: hypothetical protein EOO04_03890 [Chitinophagaceae bacterium]